MPLFSHVRPPRRLVWFTSGCNALEWHCGSNYRGYYGRGVGISTGLRDHGSPYYHRGICGADAAHAHVHDREGAPPRWVDVDRGSRKPPARMFRHVCRECRNRVRTGEWGWAAAFDDPRWLA